MKKLLCILAAFCLLLSGCSQKQKTPQELLEEAYKKAEELDSMTIRGTTDLTVNMGSEIVIPMDITMMVERNDKADLTDDLSYVEIDTELFGQQLGSKVWTQNGKSYVENVEGKYISETDTGAAATYDTGAMAKAIAENAESMEMTQSGDSTVITVKPTDKLIQALFANGGSASSVTGDMLDSEALKSMTFGDILITIGKEGYVDNVIFSANGTAEGADMTIAVDLNVTDRNTTKVPAFDPEDFAAEPATEPVTEPENDDGEYVEIGFAEDGVTAGIEAAKGSDIALYFDEEEGYVYVYDADYEDLRGLGLFLDAEFTEELIQTVRDNKDGYKFLDEVKTDIGSFVVGYAEEETDIFNPDTYFVAIRYDGYDLGYLMAGISDEADFYDMIGNLTFYTK